VEGGRDRIKLRGSRFQGREMQRGGFGCVSPQSPLTGRNCTLRLRFMEVHFTPEQQHKLAELASQRGRDAGTLAQEAIGRFLAEEARFIEAVKLGEAALGARRISHP
jgi:hypothetical protein